MDKRKIAYTENGETYNRAATLYERDSFCVALLVNEKDEDDSCLGCGWEKNNKIGWFPQSRAKPAWLVFPNDFTEPLLAMLLLLKGSDVSSILEAIHKQFQ